MRRVLALVALGLALATPGPALADDRGAQDVVVGQSSQASALALSAVSLAGGGSCFAGCPTIVVAPVSAVAFSLDLASVTQVLNHIGVRL